MLLEVVVRSISYAPQLSPCKGEFVFKIRCSLAVERQLFRTVVPEPKIFISNTQIQKPLVAEGSPVLKPFQIGSRFAEEFQLHLLKLSGSERKVSRSYFISECLSYLGNAKRYLPSGGSLYVLEIDEYSLGCLRPQVNLCLGVFSNTLIRFKHHVELSDIRKVCRTTLRASYIVILDVLGKLFISPAIHIYFLALFISPLFNNFVCPASCLAVFAVNERVVKSGYMARRLPYSGVHQNSAINTNIVLAFLDKLLPPGFLYVVLQLHTQGAVVPAVCKTTVNIRTRVNKASVFTKSNDLLH